MVSRFFFSYYGGKKKKFKRKKKPKGVKLALRDTVNTTAISIFCRRSLSTAECRMTDQITDKLQNTVLSSTDEEGLIDENNNSELDEEVENDIEDDDDIKAKNDSIQRQNNLKHIEETYGLTTIPDTNIDILPSDNELTSDIPLDTDYIDLVHLKINSLENLHLEKFLNLVTINLRDNLITSLNALKFIDDKVKAQIEELDFYDNRIKHISSHLNEFPNLAVLDLSFNNIKHIKHIENLKKLNHLYFVQNKISKIENLDSFKDLVNLELGGNKVELIENLSNLTSLEQLWLGQNKINKLQGLEMLKNLKILSIQSNKIEKIEGLQNLQNLQELYISHNKITKLENLENLVNLQVLDVTGNQIEVIEAMDTLTELTDFWCSYNKIHDFNNIQKGLQRCQQLETVYFEGNPVQLSDPTMYRRKLRLCFGGSLQKIDAMYVK